MENVKYFILYTNTSGRKTWRAATSYGEMEKICAEIAERLGIDPYDPVIDQHVHVFMSDDMLITSDET